MPRLRKWKPGQIPWIANVIRLDAGSTEQITIKRASRVGVLQDLTQLKELIRLYVGAGYPIKAVSMGEIAKFGIVFRHPIDDAMKPGFQKQGAYLPDDVNALL